MKVLVTGGAGFIGGHAAERLLCEGNSVVIVDCITNNYDTAIKYKTIENLKTIGSGYLWFYEIDINSKEMDEVFEEHQFEQILHFAAYPGVRHSIMFPQRNIGDDISATLKLLELSKTHGVKHFLFASSSSVYGKRSATPFKETTACDEPASPYAASKKACELLAYTYSHLYGLKVVCLRFFTVYGPRCRPDMAVYTFVDAISKQNPIYLFGDGSATRAFTYVSDIIDGVMSAMKLPSGYHVINLGGEQGYRVDTLIEIIESCMQSKAHIIKQEEQLGDVPITIADQSKAMEVLEFYPTVPLPLGIQRTVEWYMSFSNNKNSDKKS